MAEAEYWRFTVARDCPNKNTSENHSHNNTDSALMRPPACQHDVVGSRRRPAGGLTAALDVMPWFAAHLWVLCRAVLSLLGMKPKLAYADGTPVPPSRGWLHGAVAIAHALRVVTAPRISGPHAFLVFQYGISFVYHNAGLSAASEHLVARLDNWAIAGHITILALLAIPPGSGSLRWLLLATFAAAVGASLVAAEGVQSWGYKSMLGVLFAVSLFVSDAAHLPRGFMIACLYVAGFALFAKCKMREGAGEAEAGWTDAVLYDSFHLLQVLATLTALSTLDYL
jgi:hypothetical protein